MTSTPRLGLRIVSGILAAALLLGCSGRDVLVRAPRPDATSTPAATGPKGAAAIAPPSPLATPVAAGEPAGLDTESQLAAVTAPTRDLRDLSMRLNPTGQEIPLVAAETAPVYVVGDTLDFWVHDVDNNRNYQIQAQLAHQNEVVNAWVEAGQPFEQEAIAQSMDRFAANIYPALTAFFGSEWKPGIDGDTRLNVLHAKGLGSSVIGYYSSADQYSRLANEFSNEKEMFYINLAWLNATDSYAFYETVLAHELQHMIHWRQDRNEDTWLNEGLSMYAQEVAGYPADMLYVNRFVLQPDTQLNDWNEVSVGNTEHYGAAYLFVAYFAQRFGPELTRAVVAEAANGIAGFDAVLEAAGRPERFGDLFIDWVIANYVGDANALGLDGVYGYRGLHPDAPVLAAKLDRLPVEAEQFDVRNFAADYFSLEGGEPVVVRFAGQTETRLAAAEPYSGRQVWWSNRGDDTNTRLTRRFDLSAVEPGAAVEMQAALWWSIEEGYDYGYVAASRDGLTWEILPGEHTRSDDPAGNSFGPGYSGSSGGAGPVWVEESWDLSAYAGAEVWVRFEYVTDDAVNLSGWLVDDIAIPAIGYFSDFEAGADGWEAEGWLLTDNVLPQRWAVQVMEFQDGILQDVRRADVVDGEAGMSVALGEGRTAALAISGLTVGSSEPAQYTLSVSTE